MSQRIVRKINYSFFQFISKNVSFSFNIVPQEGGAKMNEKEIRKLNVIIQIENGKMSKNEAMEELNLSKRQINRLIIKYNEEGAEGFIHKNKGKISTRRTEEEIKCEIVNLYLTEYYDYNFSHFYEDAIKNKFAISYPNMINILKKENIISPLAYHRTKNEYNKQMKTMIKNKTISEEYKELYETRLLKEEQAHTRKSNLFLKFGEELQMDAAEYMWFGEIVTQLHLVVDRATKMVLFGWFDYQETTRAYFVLLYNVIYLYGIPKKIRTDKRKVFYNENNENTQFGRICKELKIELASSSNPRFKPNVERENKTFENRLKAELRHENIKTIKEANQYLNDIFIPKINAKFAFKIEKSKTLMRPNKYNIKELALIVSEKYERMIDTGAYVKYNTKYYIPIDDNNKEIYLKNKTPITIIIDYNNDMWCLIEQNYYKLKEIKKKEYTPAMAAREIEEEIKKERKKYIPPANHPWRQSYKNKI